MSETKAGNLAAIRDWGDHYFYDKSEVAEFFMKLNEELTAYKLTIVGPADTDITINDNDQTNPQEYVIKTSSNGIYTGLFFFNEGNTLSLQGGEIAATHVLTNYIDIITLVPLVIANANMTGYTTPSGEVSASAYASTSSGTYYPWYAFKHEVQSNIRLIWSSGEVASRWIQYKFDDPVCIIKLTVQNANIHDGFSGKKFIFQASNDGVNFTNLGEYSIDSSVKLYKSEYDIPNANSYLYYRLNFTEWYSNNSVEVGCINLYKPDI